MVKEKYIEGKFTKIAYHMGFIGLRLSLRGRRGWPDHLYIGPKRSFFFVEFKRYDIEPTRLQKFVHEKLREMGINVYVVYKPEAATGICKKELRT